MKTVRTITDEEISVLIKGQELQEHWWDLLSWIPDDRTDLMVENANAFLEEHEIDCRVIAVLEQTEDGKITWRRK
jgi:hypothetical protein